MIKGLRVNFQLPGAMSTSLARCQTSQPRAAADRPVPYNEDARRGLRVLGGLNAQSWLIQTTEILIMSKPEFQVVAPAIENTSEPDTFTPTDQQLDEDEMTLRALRLDLPGTGGTPTGIVSIAVSDRFPRREFFRTHPTHTAVLPMVDHAAGMDVEYHIVTPPMVPELASIGVDDLYVPSV